MDSHVHLVQEIDGVRVIGNETHELLQKVPSKLSAKKTLIILLTLIIDTNLYSIIIMTLVLI